MHSNGSLVRIEQRWHRKQLHYWVWRRAQLLLTEEGIINPHFLLLQSKNPYIFSPLLVYVTFFMFSLIVIIEDVVFFRSYHLSSLTAMTSPFVSSVVNSSCEDRMKSPAVLITEGQLWVFLRCCASLRVQVHSTREPDNIEKHGSIVNV
jgi:hypothetical protein